MTNENIIDMKYRYQIVLNTHRSVMLAHGLVITFMQILMLVNETFIIFIFLLIGITIALVSLIQVYSQYCLIQNTMEVM